MDLDVFITVKDMVIRPDFVVSLTPRSIIYSPKPHACYVIRIYIMCMLCSISDWDPVLSNANKVLICSWLSGHH